MFENEYNRWPFQQYSSLLIGILNCDFMKIYLKYRDDPPHFSYATYSQETTVSLDMMELKYNICWRCGRRGNQRKQEVAKKLGAVQVPYKLWQSVSDVWWSRVVHATTDILVLWTPEQL